MLRFDCQKKHSPVGSPDAVSFLTVSILPSWVVHLMITIKGGLTMTNIVSGTLTVIFDPPFYKGIFECHFAETYQIAQVILGTSAPTSRQIEEFLIHRWKSLDFFQSDQAPIPLIRKINPKRLSRLANKSIRTTGVGTKAQQALQKQRESKKAAHKKQYKMFRDQQKQLIYQKKRKKHQEKHKGH
ncbi:DUF2992 family protein [Lentilactobacillus hilgardii]|nr:DUF2992 family protein [Lentilactobacillus hilgardii]